VAPAVSGVIPKGKGKKVSAIPQIHTASFNGDLVSAISAHLNKESSEDPPKSEIKPLTADEPAKKAPEKKPEEKESENEVKKAAIDLPGTAAPPAQMPALGAPDMPQPDAAAGGGINMDEILKQLGGGLETIGSKSMSGVGSAMGAMGMPGAQDQLNAWSQDPGVSKGVGGGVSVLGAILAAYLLRRLTAGGGEGMEQSAGLQCQDMLKKAGPLGLESPASAVTPAPAPAPVAPAPAAPAISPKALAQGRERAQSGMNSLATKPAPIPSMPQTMSPPPAMGGMEQFAGLRCQSLVKDAIFPLGLARRVMGGGYKPTTPVTPPTSPFGLVRQVMLGKFAPPTTGQPTADPQLQAAKQTASQIGKERAKGAVGVPQPISLNTDSGGSAPAAGASNAQKLWGNTSLAGLGTQAAGAVQSKLPAAGKLLGQAAKSRIPLGIGQNAAPKGPSMAAAKTEAAGRMAANKAARPKVPLQHSPAVEDSSTVQPPKTKGKWF